MTPDERRAYHAQYYAARKAAGVLLAQAMVPASGEGAPHLIAQKETLCHSCAPPHFTGLW